MHAKSIIAKLGGVRAAAALLGKPPSTVSHWIASGFIPAQHQQETLDAARANGIELSPADFFDAPPGDVDRSPSDREVA